VKKPYGIHHDRPYTILCTNVLDILKCAAICLVRPVSPCMALICAAISAVSLCARLGFVMAWRTPRALAWRLFSVGVLHSRFSTWLLRLSPSLWLTHGRCGEGGRKALATRRCTKRSDTERYPLAHTLRRIGRISPCCMLRTLPKLLTSWYVQPMQGFQISISTPVSGGENISLPYSGRIMYRH